jgi:electron transfer flavoprotein beta subunit
MADERPLHLLVLIKFVPDPAQLQAGPGGEPDLAHAPFRISTFDENAVEAALGLAAASGGRVFGLSLVRDPVPPRDVLLRALAMGLDALYIVRDVDGLCTDPLPTATVLAAAARVAADRESVSGWDIVVGGEASADQYNAQVGPRLAVALGMPAVTYASSLALRDGGLVAQRVLEQRAEEVEARLPVLVTVGMEINQPRIPTVLQVMGAGRKPVHELALGDLPGVDVGALQASPGIETLSVLAPPSTRKGVEIVGETPAQVARALLDRLVADGEVKQG